MREGHDLRWGGLAGVGAVVLAIVARLVMGGAPASTDTMGVIASYMNDNRGRILLAVLLYSAAIALFLWFGAALATAFRRAVCSLTTGQNGRGPYGGHPRRCPGMRH